MTETHRSGCLEANMLAEYIDGGLEPRERAKVEEHLAECEECYENFSETVRAGLAAASDLAPLISQTNRRSRSAWWLGAAAAAIVVVGIGLQNRWWIAQGDRQLAELVSVTNTRPSEGRLTGGFRWAKPEDTTRSGAAKAATPEVSIAAAKLEQALTQGRSFETLRAYGSGQLVLGNLDMAIQAFREASALNASAIVLSDLSAALLARGARDGREVDFAEAADTAARAVEAAPRLPEAIFNRAVTLEHLGQDDQAILAWQKYLALDGTSAWATEARSRLESLKAKAKSPGREAARKRVLDALLPAWAAQIGSAAADATLREASTLRDQVEAGSSDRFLSDVLLFISSTRQPAALARSTVEYGDAWKRYAARDYAAAASAFRAAGVHLSETGSPLRYSAALGEAVSLYNLRRYAEVIATVDRSQRDIPTMRYPALRARGLWLKGIALISTGRQQSGLDAYAEARAGYESAREPANAAFLDGLMAEGFNLLGDNERSWQHRIRALAVARQSTMFVSAAIAARRSGWSALAASLQDSAIDAARSAKDDGALADALRERALSYGASGNISQASAVLTEASARIVGKEGPEWTRLRAEIDLSTARVADPSALPNAVEAANRAVSFFESARIAVKLPSAYLARANVLEAIGDASRARADLMAGLDRYQEQRTRLAPGPLTASLGDVARELVDRYARLSVSAGDPGAAFAAIDRNRTTGLEMTARPEALQQQVPQGASVLYFAVSPDETMVWAITAAGVKFHRAQVSAGELTALVEQVAEHGDDGASRRLVQQLLDPVTAGTGASDAYFIVPDGPLYRLPFAGLTLADGRLLISEHPVILAPSASWLIARPARSVPAANPRMMSIAAFGNPAFDREEFPGLPSLAAAEREADEASQPYARHEVSVGRAVTRGAIERALRAKDVVHFGGHALVDFVDPNRSLLVLAPDATPPLTAEAVTALRGLKAKLLILAACQSATGRISRSEGTLGLAQAFLRTGVGTVVASLSDLGDAFSRALFLTFHERYAATGDAARALQASQIALLRGGVGTDRRWARLVVFGGWDSTVFSTNQKGRTQ